MDLVGAAEIADLLGVSRQRVHQLSEMPGFPEPVGIISGKRIWLRSDIERWAREQGRLGPEEQ